MEDQILRALEKYVNAHVMGPWMMSIFGIGPVISAGLLAHIDVEWMECSVCQKKETAAKKCKCGAPYVRKTLATAGQVWRYAGLDPTTQWEKKTKRPWNAELKVLCWKAGKSFWKFHKKPKCFYGHIFAKQKLVYADRNEAGDYADRSATILTEKKFKKDTDAYKAYSVGKFPPAHIHAMARRYAVKQFLSDLHAVWHFVEFGALAPKPWIIEEGGHAHFGAPAEHWHRPGIAGGVCRIEAMIDERTISPERAKPWERTSKPGASHAMRENQSPRASRKERENQRAASQKT